MCVWGGWGGWGGWGVVCVCVRGQGVCGGPTIVWFHAQVVGVTEWGGGRHRLMGKQLSRLLLLPYMPPPPP